MCSTRRRAARLVLPGALAALLLVAAGPAPAQGQNKVVYDRFDWKIYSSTHFRIYYYGKGEEASARSPRWPSRPTTTFRGG
jgi:hypothetical protein